MGEVAGVQHESGRRLERVDLFDSGIQRRYNVGIRCLVKADVAVADLYEAELALQLLGGVLAHVTQGERFQHSALQDQKSPGPGPSHALEKSAAVDPVFALIVCDVVRHAVS